MARMNMKKEYPMKKFSDGTVITCHIDKSIKSKQPK
jgi:macrodomain Ter protein organizer (MatP/YcbG family)